MPATSRNLQFVVLTYKWEILQTEFQQFPDPGRKSNPGSPDSQSCELPPGLLHCYYVDMCLHLPYQDEL